MKFFSWLKQLFKKDDEIHQFIVTHADGSQELRVYKNGKRVDKNEILRNSITKQRKI